MRYGGVDHSFDRRGFVFVIQLLVLCGVGVGGAYAVYPLVQSHWAPAPLAQLQAAPLIPAPAAPVLSSTTPQRVINALTVAEAVPKEGKFIAADLVHMKVLLYQDGTTTAEYPILTKGKSGTPWETPSGFYAVQTKEVNHFSTIGHVTMPYSMQFYGNYFLHGWPTYPDGTPVASSFSGGCIRLSTADAAEVFAFADRGTGLFVYDTKAASTTVAMPLAPQDEPLVTAHSYLVADIDSGDVYLEHNASAEVPIASVTKLMTALVANEIISFEKVIPLPPGEVLAVGSATTTEQKHFLIGDLLYPLLMESNNHVADELASFYGTSGFVQWMNTTAKALGMRSTKFADASGASAGNVSTPDDLFRLAVYLATKKSFVWDITRTPTKTFTAADGSTYTLSNFNVFADNKSFVGGKVGHTTAAGDTMVSVFSMTPPALLGEANNTQKHRIAVVVLGSDDYTADTNKLTEWLTASVARGVRNRNAACTSCVLETDYRKIEF